MKRARRSAYIWFAVSALVLSLVVVGFGSVVISLLDKFFATGFSIAGIAYIIGCMSLARGKGRHEILGLVGILFPLGLAYLIWLPLPRGSEFELPSSNYPRYPKE